MAKQRKSEAERSVEKSIELILKQKDKLVAERLRMEIRNRIIERRMNALSNELNSLINKLLDAPPSLSMQELRTAQINRLEAIHMVRDRLPNLPLEAARDLVNETLQHSRRNDGEERL